MLDQLLQDVVDRHEYTPGKKSSERVLTSSLKDALEAAGYEVDSQDSRKLLPNGLSVWRYGEWIEPTPGRRKIDIVVYRDGELAALIESEEDLNDVKLGESFGRYFVQSLAKTSAGAYFPSYKSLERMAAAVYIAKHDTHMALERLQLITSDDLTEHNPLNIPTFLTLACGFGDRGTRWRTDVLTPRIKSIGCRIVARNK